MSSFKVPGRVLSARSMRGRWCKAGQLVARLDSADLTHEVDIRRAEAQTARAALRELEAGSRKEEIAQAEAALAAAEAEANRLADDFRRQQELFDREVIPKQKFDAAKGRPRQLPGPGPAGPGSAGAGAQGTPTGTDRPGARPPGGKRKPPWRWPWNGSAIPP